MRKFFVLLLAATLVLTMTAGIAQAKGKGTTKGPKPDKPVTYTFEGTIYSVDEATSTVVVTVEEANKMAGSFAGQQVTFNVTAQTKKVVLNDEPAGLADLKADDSVTVRARALRGATYPTTTSFTAWIIDAQSAPSVPADPVV